MKNKKKKLKKNTKILIIILVVILALIGIGYYLINNFTDKGKSKVKVIDEIPEVRDDNSFLKVTEKIKEQTETYLTYRVYIFKQDDTIEKVLEKYDITLEQLSDYNNLDEISEGVKLVIPSFND